MQRKRCLGRMAMHRCEMPAIVVQFHGTPRTDLKHKAMEQEKQWRRLNGDRIKQPIEDEIREVLVMEKKEGHSLKVCIGTDSQVKGKATEFATVIVFIRKGKGGFMYIHNEITRQKMSIKQRMLMEVSKSIDIAYHLC